jgi:ubiquinol-cytochrome c reductase cytochrome b subunit
LPCTIAFAFCVQAITGFFLWAYYSPSEQTAWESVYFLQNEVAGGWLLRAIHHYSAHVLLAMLILYVVQCIFTRAYRAPRELVFWATVGLGLCALAAVLTGDLLSWDQNGYASTKTRTGFLTFLPLVGGSLLRIAIGGPGPALGHLTLTRFFALHVGLFAAAFLLLLILRGVLARRANAVQVAEGLRAVSYWPAQACRVAVASLLVMVVVVGLACQHGVTPPHAGAPLLSPADTNPANAYNAARPEWFLVGVYEFSHLFPGQWAIVPIFIVPGLVLCLVLAMPFLARRTIGQVFSVTITVALLIGLVAMSYHSLAKDRADPTHQKAIALEEWQAQRVLELIRQHQGIPPTGALSLLENDAKVEGRRLFTQYCATCHNHGTNSDVAEIGEDIWTEQSTAPNLSGFASRRWLTGLLDPKQIVGPQYYGNTKLRTSKMVAFVKGTLAELDADGKKNLEKAIAALSAEAKLPAQRDLDAKDSKWIEEGRDLIVDDFGCTDCHKFHDKGTQGDAPNLTGYGSPEWMAGVISNPAAKRFYGKLNDRMPAYAASATDPSQNTLTARQIELLTDWLRGQWCQPERETGD